MSGSTGASGIIHWPIDAQDTGKKHRQTFGLSKRLAAVDCLWVLGRPHGARLPDPKCIALGLPEERMLGWVLVSASADFLDFRLGKSRSEELGNFPLRKGRDIVELGVGYDLKHKAPFNACVDFVFEFTACFNAIKRCVFHVPGVGWE